MSSRTPWRSRAALAVLALAAPVLAAGPAAAADVPLPVTAVFPAATTSTLVLDLSASDRRAGALTVTADGKPRQATLLPVVSPGLALALVIDDARDGAADLAAWSSAAARFSLAAPADTRAVVISSAAPARVLDAPQVGPVGIVRTLNGMAAHGTRDTGAALALAARQFPGVPAGRRVVVLYTGARDAGDVPAEALGAEFRRSGTILVVVGTAAGSAFWGAATEGTGGFFAPAGEPVVVPALDQVQTTLASRYLVQLATPARLPAHLSVRVTTPDATFTGPADIPALPAPAGTGGDHGFPVWWWAAGGVLVGVIAAAVALTLTRPRRPVAATAADPTPVRGRVAVPGAAPGHPVAPPAPPGPET